MSKGLIVRVYMRLPYSNIKVSFNYFVVAIIAFSGRFCLNLYVKKFAPTVHRQIYCLGNHDAPNTAVVGPTIEMIFTKCNDVQNSANKREHKHCVQHTNINKPNNFALVGVSYIL
jgi:hypothetical protein